MKHLRFGKCVYCLEESTALTWDHVFPESWYPDTTPEDLEKWKVPCCEKCNSRFGKIEENLFLRLGLCIDPKEYRSSGIPEKVLRALDSSKGRDERDIRARKKKKDKILKEIVRLKDNPLTNFFPNFGLPPKTIIDDPRGIIITPEDLESLTTKIVKGVTYINNGLYIDGTYQIEMYIAKDTDIQEVIQLLDKFGVIYTREPGFFVKCAIVDGEKFAGLYSIEIWGKLKMYASVVPSVV